jgi:hypothetical protein
VYVCPLEANNNPSDSIIVGRKKRRAQSADSKRKKERKKESLFYCSRVQSVSIYTYTDYIYTYITVPHY